MNERFKSSFSRRMPLLWKASTGLTINQQERHFSVFLPDFYVSLHSKHPHFVYTFMC